MCTVSQLRLCNHVLLAHLSWTADWAAEENRIFGVCLSPASPQLLADSAFVLASAFDGFGGEASPSNRFGAIATGMVWWGLCVRPLQTKQQKSSKWNRSQSTIKADWSSAFKYVCVEIFGMRFYSNSTVHRAHKWWSICFHIFAHTRVMPVIIVNDFQSDALAWYARSQPHKTNI